MTRAGKILLLLLFLAAGACLGGCGTDEEALIRREISVELRLDLSEIRVLGCVDTHGGFHGDGETFAVFQLEEETEKQDLVFRKTRCWKRLPSSVDVRAAAYGRGEQSSLLSSRSDGIPKPPVIEDGWYYFADRHDQSVDPGDEGKFLDRNSYNFVMAFYDAATRRLYYYRVDT